MRAAPRRVRSSPRGAPRDSKSAFTRVCDALCVAGTAPGCSGIAAFAGVSGLSAASRTTRGPRVPCLVRRRERLVFMVVVVCVPISTMFRVEWRLDRGEPRAQAAQHLFQHAVAPDAQPVAYHLHLSVAIADVPGEARELVRACGRDLEERLRLAGH